MKMHSKIIGAVSFDADALHKDIKEISGMPFSNAHSEYRSGKWTTLMLANKSGDCADEKSYEYSGKAKITKLGKKTPYLFDVINTFFRQEDIKSVRIFKAYQRGLVIPHRDYMGADRKHGFIRVHLPIQTIDEALNSENEFVYHMQVGEIWYLDGNEPHAGGCFNDSGERLHMVIDYDGNLAPEECVQPGAQIQREPKLIQRPEFTPQDKLAILNLGTIVNEDNVNSLLHFLAPIHFSRQVAAQAVYQWLDDIAQCSGNAKIMQTTNALRKKLIGDTDTTKYTLQ